MREEALLEKLFLILFVVCQEAFYFDLRLFSFMPIGSSDSFGGIMTEWGPQLWHFGSSMVLDLIL